MKKMLILAITFFPSVLLPLNFNITSHSNKTDHGTKKVRKVILAQKSGPQQPHYELGTEELRKFQMQTNEFQPPLSSDLNRNDENENENFAETAPPENSLRVILTPLHATTLSSEVVITTVEEIPKKMGESFQKEDLLIKLDDTIFKGAVMKAEGAVLKTRAALDSKEQLFNKKIASYLDLKVAESDLAAAEAELITAKHSLEQCTLLAPYDGKVITVFVEEHEIVQQGKPLIEIVEDGVLIGKILVPAHLINYFSIGKEVTINIRESNQTVIGKVVRIDAVIDPSSSMIKVDVEIDNKDRQLRSGMIGILQIKDR